MTRLDDDDDDDDVDDDDDDDAADSRVFIPRGYNQPSSHILCRLAISFI